MEYYHAVTKRPTRHGGPVHPVDLPVGVKIRVIPAGNLPDESNIKYWVSKIERGQVTADRCKRLHNQMVFGTGIGLHEDDIEILREVGTDEPADV